MKSFSPFRPVEDGTPAQIKTKTFAMWLRANAANVRKPFERSKWRTARPWLSFNDVRYQLRMYRDRSLGAVTFGSIVLKDKDVETAVKYEAYATRQIVSEDIRKMILELYDFHKRGKEKKRHVLDNINAEFTKLGRGYVSERSISWKAAIKHYVSHSTCMLRPKISGKRVADLIMELFDPGGQTVTAENIYFALLPYLNKMGEKLNPHSPIIQRALAITGNHLTPKNEHQIIRDTVKKYYVRHKLAKEPLKRLQFIVNLKCNIPPSRQVWKLVDTRIVPKHDWHSDEYEEALHKEYHDAPVVDPLQEPFMRHKLPYKYIRKKQHIPWAHIIKMCERKGGTDEHTLYRINYLLEINGFIPYHIAHPVFDIIRVQGLRIRNLPDDASEPGPTRFPRASALEDLEACCPHEQDDSGASPR